MHPETLETDRLEAGPTRPLGCTPRRARAVLPSGGVGLLLLLFTAPANCDRGPEPAPGAASARTAALRPEDRTIRVLLAGGLTGCRITAGGPVALDDPLTGRRIRQDVRASAMLVEFDQASVRLPQLEPTIALQMVDVVPAGGPFTLDLGRGSPARYHGVLRLCCTPDLGGTAINVLDVEDYLVGVVAAELPGSFEMETFRAQAIAARTYAWHQKRTAGPQRSYDLTATESSQVYSDLARQDQVPQAVQAVRATDGVVLTWAGAQGRRIFPTYYCSRCGGSTQSAAAVGRGSPIPPLAGDVLCERCRREPAAWGPVRLDKPFITGQLRNRYPAFESIGPIERVQVIETTESGRPVRLSFADEQGRSLQLEAENFRLACDPTGRVVRSTLFTIQDDTQAITLTDGRGFGHGIGLCQYGANDMARSGKRAGEILRHYYPGAQLDLAY